jgi:hypothetical protein
MDGACSTYGGRGEVQTGFWRANLRVRDYLEDPGVDGGIILRWIFRKWDRRVWTGLICLRIGTGWGGFCECADESSGPIICREFID